MIDMLFVCATLLFYSYLVQIHRRNGNYNDVVVVAIVAFAIIDITDNKNPPS